MSKTANPTLVGSFVIGALALTIGAIILLGNLSFQDKVLKCVLYFSGSIHGLDIGAPVTLRGVQVGRVTSIEIDFDRRQKNYTIPVYICIEKRKENSDTPQPWDQEIVGQIMRQMIDKGLKAQLKSRSLITGKLYVDLDFYPEIEPVFLNSSPETIEIPTIQSGLDQITEVLQNFPLQEMIDKVNTALDGLNHLLNSEESRDVLRTVASSLHKVDELLTQAQQELPGLVHQLENTLADISAFSNSGSSLLETTQGDIEPVFQGIQQTLGNMDSAFDQLTRTLEKIGTLVDEDSAIPYDLATTIREIGAAAQSVKRLTDELQRRPDSLFFGRRETP